MYMAAPSRTCSAAASAARSGSPATIAATIASWWTGVRFERWLMLLRLTIANRAQVRAKSRADHVGEFFRRVGDPPSIEISRLLIESWQNAREKLRIVRVAVSRR